MLNTYKAKLKGSQIEGVDEVPPSVNGGTTDVLVTLLPHMPETLEEKLERGARMKAALERIAARGGIQSIPDPVAWQREMREDRPLPGRDD